MFHQLLGLTRSISSDYSNCSINQLTIVNISISNGSTVNSTELMKSLMETCNLVATASYCERCYQQAIDSEMESGQSSAAPSSSSRNPRYASTSSATMSGFPSGSSSVLRSNVVNSGVVNQKGFVFLMRQLFAMNGYALCTVDLMFPPTAQKSSANPSLDSPENPSSSSSISNSNSSSKKSKRLQTVTVSHAILFPMGLNRAVLYVEERTTSQQVLFTTIWKKHLIEPNYSTVNVGKAVLRRTTNGVNINRMKSESGGLFDDGALMIDSSTIQAGGFMGSSNAKITRGLTAVSSINSAAGENSQLPSTRLLRRQTSLSTIANASAPELAASHERSLLQMINASSDFKGNGVRSASRMSNTSEDVNMATNGNIITSTNPTSDSYHAMDGDVSNLFPQLTNNSGFSPSSKVVSSIHNLWNGKSSFAEPTVENSSLFVSASGFDHHNDDMHLGEDQQYADQPLIDESSILSYSRSRMVSKSASINSSAIPPITCGGLFHSVVNNVGGNNSVPADTVAPAWSSVVYDGKDDNVDDNQTQSTMEDNLATDWIDESIDELEKEQNKLNDQQIGTSDVNVRNNTADVDENEEEANLKQEEEQARIKEEQQKIAKVKLASMLERIDTISCLRSKDLIVNALVNLDTCPITLTFQLLDVFKPEINSEIMNAIDKKGKTVLIGKQGKRGKKLSIEYKISSSRPYGIIKEILREFKSIMGYKFGSDLHVVKAFSLVSLTYCLLSIEVGIIFKKSMDAFGTKGKSMKLPFNIFENVQLALSRLQSSLGSPVLTTVDLKFLLSLDQSLLCSKYITSEEHMKIITDIIVKSSRIELVISLLRVLYQDSLKFYNNDIQSIEMNERLWLWKLIEPLVEEYDYAKNLTIVSPIKVNINSSSSSTNVGATDTSSTNLAPSIALSLAPDLEEAEGNPVVPESIALQSETKVIEELLTTKATSNISSGTGNIGVKKPPLPPNTTTGGNGTIARSNSLVSERKQLLGHRLAMGKTKAITVNPNISAHNRKISSMPLSGAIGAATTGINPASSLMPPPVLPPSNRTIIHNKAIAREATKRYSNMKRSISDTDSLPVTSLPDNDAQQAKTKDEFAAPSSSWIDDTLTSPQPKRSRGESGMVYNMQSPEISTPQQDPSFSQVRIIDCTPLPEQNRLFGTYYRDDFPDNSNQVRVSELFGSGGGNGRKTLYDEGTPTYPPLYGSSVESNRVTNNGLSATQSTLLDIFPSSPSHATPTKLSRSIHQSHRSKERVNEDDEHDEDGDRFVTEDITLFETLTSSSGHRSKFRTVSRGERSLLAVTLASSNSNLLMPSPIATPVINRRNSQFISQSIPGCVLKRDEDQIVVNSVGSLSDGHTDILTDTASCSESNHNMSGRSLLSHCSVHSVGQSSPPSTSTSKLIHTITGECTGDDDTAANTSLSHNFIEPVDAWYIKADLERKIHSITEKGSYEAIGNPVLSNSQRHRHSSTSSGTRIDSTNRRTLRQFHRGSNSAK